MRSPAGTIFAILVAFLVGFSSHLLYQRWNAAEPDRQKPDAVDQSATLEGTEAQSFRVSFAPLPVTPATDHKATELATVIARDIEKIRSLTGRQARIRGRVFRVGHSAKSNTYFLNFGPSREALTAVIFNSAAELFEKNQQPPKQFENREVEIVGFIKDHPQYGLEVILENPKQIKIVN
ncbi:MAG: hypothetical protein ACREQ2_15115 [Candidatus Binatia bacterium]